MENILDRLGHHDKWHLKQNNRTETVYSINEPIIDYIFEKININDGFFATDGICTHEDVHLEDGLVTDDEIECPMHQGIFNIKTGAVIQDPPCEDLRTYAVKLEEEKIYINIV